MHTSYDCIRSKVTASRGKKEQGGSSTQTKLAESNILSRICGPVLTWINRLLSGKPRPFSREENNTTTPSGTGRTVLTAARGMESGQETTKDSENGGSDQHTGVSASHNSNEPTSGAYSSKDTLEESYSNAMFRDPILDTL